jgi:hypothetical protein
MKKSSRVAESVEILPSAVNGRCRGELEAAKSLMVPE